MSRLMLDVKILFSATRELLSAGKNLYILLAVRDPSLFDPKGKHPQSTLIALYIRLTKAYAVRKPTVPVNNPYTRHAKKLYAKCSIVLTKPVMCKYLK